MENPILEAIRELAVLGLPGLFLCLIVGVLAGCAWLVITTGKLACEWIT